MEQWGLETKRSKWKKKNKVSNQQQNGKANIQ